MAATLKYNLRQINDIASSEFQFKIPEDVYNMINYLSTQVGTAGLSSPVFVRPEQETSDSSMKEPGNAFASISKNKKKKGNKCMEVSSEEWERLEHFKLLKLSKSLVLMEILTILDYYLIN